MERRKLLAMAGVSIPTALAGCASSDDPDYEGSNGDDDDGSTGSDDGSGDGGNGGPSDDEISITEHDLVIDEGDFIDEIYIEGIVANNADEMANYAQVTARVYDADGNQLDSYIDNTNDLDAGGSWAFEMMVLEDAEDVDDYDIAVEDITW